MVVIDGIVMGPCHCAMEGCEAGLQNAQTGVFSKKHVEKMKKKCHMKGCGKAKATFCRRYANTSLLEVQQMLRRAQEERQEWLPAGGEVEAVEHDNLEEQEVEEVSGTKYQNYFSAPRYYCVETICASCGFAKAEGVAKILKFLEDVYPDSASHPSYIAIDKGCALLKHIVRQGHWIAWEPTTRIIVTDHLCRTWCNPAPLNGDAPNLACEQLNAWIGGNFDFTMHVLLFIHTQQVIAKQEKKKRKREAGIEVVESDEESEDGEDSEGEEESDEEESEEEKD
ncbi:hypothetical protein BDN71DRAFT_1483465 [Pleurotus eryngii]|uniref:CxC6 like cysteine cluster associated with KDZ domain-containing protein n=1 Tax=Pleurotus eryngii TaxID=5323 RepID=A0A9P5ZSJ7_PLEER|nr:hypothetical protein BDN71DRAFT_1483465 [Pleurotus eryngii]